MYFLRTNGNKPLLVYFLVNCAQGGRGPGQGLPCQLCPLGLIVPSSGLGSSGLWRLGSRFPEADPGGRGGTAAHAGKASAARPDRGRHRTQDRGAGGAWPAAGCWGSAPEGPLGSRPPHSWKSRAKSAGCFGDPGLRGAHAASFSHDLTGRAEPGRWAAPPTPEPEPEPLSGRPPLPAPSAARGHIGPGAGAKPGVPPPRLSPTSRQPQLELALTLHWAWTTSSGDFSLLCPRQPLAAEM